MPAQHLPDTLTEREQDIARLIADGLSNHDIAEKLVLTYGTVKWYCNQIYGKLGVRSRAQTVRVLQSVPISENAISSHSVSQIRLPTPLTPFIGREREIVDVRRLLQRNRLLTLTGAGGTGKTRLALAVARDAVGDFADGVSFVDLAPVSDIALVVKAIAHVLGIMENPSEAALDTLKRALAEQEHLFLVDNFEQVIEAAPILSQLLASAPRLKILVTSREALRVSGEQEYAVPPLTLPVAAGSAPDDIRQSEAVRLFRQQAIMRRPDFKLTDDNIPVIAEICIRLDGLPLAIELAVAYSNLFSPQALLIRLDSRLNTLTGGTRDAPARQQTLRNTIEWSYNLLDEREKRLFARLAVFRGGCSFEAVEVICGEGDDLHGLASLANKSLIQQKADRNGGPRFTMLETLREFAWERLIASGEADVIRRRHADYFVGLAEQAEPELRLARQVHWFQILERERENFRIALEWSMSGGEMGAGLRIAGALHLFWFATGYHAEGYEWTQRLQKRLNEAPLNDQAKFLVSAAQMANFLDPDDGNRLYKKAIAVARSIGDQLQLAWALTLSPTAMLGDIEQAMSHAKQGLVLFQELDDQAGVAQALIIIGELARLEGDYQQARSVYEESLGITQQLGDMRLTYILFVNLSIISRHEGDHRRALDLIREGLKLGREVSSRFDLACDLANIAASTAALGYPERAARLPGFSEAALETIGAFYLPIDRPQIDGDIAAVRVLLDEATFQAAWAEGRRMTPEQAVADALSETP